MTSFTYDSDSSTSSSTTDQLSHLETTPHLPGISPPSITIGLELELILFHLPPHLPPLPFIATALHPLSHKLQTLAIPFTIQTPTSTPIPSSALLHPTLFFQIKPDGSINPTHPTLPTLHGSTLEIATPILRTKSWEWAIPEMCHALTTACTAVGASIGFNASTGLHVHIGVGREYTLAELKRVAKAVVVFERRMDLHHDVCRRGETRMWQMYPCWMSPGLRGLSGVEMVERIEAQTCVRGLLATVNGHVDRPGRAARCYRYNLTAVGRYGTVEFRQGMGTCDAGVVLGWVGNVVRFVTAAVETGDEEFCEWAGLEGGVVDEEVLRRFGALVE